MIQLDKAEILQLLDLEAAAEAVANAYRAASEGRVTLPPVGHITFPERGADCHIKFGHQHGAEVFVVKLATGFPQNEHTPKNNGLSLVLSALDGSLQAVLHDEGHLTDVRTGLGGAIASRALARPDARSLVIVGTGTQAIQQIEAHRALLPQKLHVTLWGRSRAKAERCAAEVGGVAVADELEAACRSADILVTTTAAREPLVLRDWIRPGTQITAVGADAPGKQELTSELLHAAQCRVADSFDQCLDHGEFSALASTERATVVELGDVLAGRAEGRSTLEDISIADLTGIAAQDIAIAGVVLDAQRQQESRSVDSDAERPTEP
ncbi:MAG: ornithine cyclodeaminase family protein [Acidobacteriota bacterium]